MIEALLTVSHSIAAAHHRWRRSLGRSPLSGEIARLETRLRRIEAENELLRRRILRVPARRRPYYRPWERLEILWHRARYNLSMDQTAHAFALTRNTILNWEAALRRGDQKAVGAKRTLARLPDLVRELTERLKFEWPDWGTRRIAGVLAQMGVRVSRTTVQRILRSRGPRPTPSEPSLSSPVTPHAPGEVWLADFTEPSHGTESGLISYFSRSRTVRLWS